MKLQPQQHYRFANKIYETLDNCSVAYNMSDDDIETIDTPDRDEVVLLTGKVLVADGHLYFDRMGRLHRDDGPAVDRLYRRTWYKHGKKHRIGGPADCSEGVEGFGAWYINDELHRIGAPAYEGSNGEREWWVDGRLHRDNGPAVDYINGRQEWYVEGRRHRTDGPAMIDPDGAEKWFVNGKELEGLTKMLLQYQTQSAEAVL